MATSILNKKDYYRIVYGGWLGKNIGGTLGAPVEGKKELLNLTFYPELPDGPLENDDLDLQLVWLHALEQYGPKLTARELGQEWKQHIFFPFDEYGYALTNLRRGLQPPVTGAFDNPFADCMGSPIRSEIWAMVAPGAPEAAAYYAYQDAIVDHAGGEGVYGEMFFAAIESAIFYEQDRDRLLELGFGFIPAESRTALALRDLLKWHKEGKSWLEARELILLHHGHDNFTDAPQNVAFTILGWLYGENFEDAILKAVNCGYDTDCTAATLGAILGMIAGPEGLPEKWAKPVGDRIVVSPAVNGFPAPANLHELTERTIRMGKHVLAAWDTDIIIHEQLATDWQRETPSVEAVLTSIGNTKTTINRYLLPQGSAEEADLELVIDYGKEGPVAAIGKQRTLQVTFTNRSRARIEGYLSLALPDGWAGSASLDIRLEPGSSASWEAEIVPAGRAQTSYELAVQWTRLHDGSVWDRQTVPFSLVAAVRWLVQGPEDSAEQQLWSAGSRLELEEHYGDAGAADGVYRVRTEIHNPAERTIRLIVAANAAYKARLNGETIVECPSGQPWMPAYHRAPVEQTAEITLQPGTHKFELDITREGAPLQIYVLPIATRDTAMPGPCYYYTDIRLGLDEG
ncbi:hypothetical protein EBB07_01260 [Paenibacillaceae bacterium]|nr:hypothetical protein EBB07_01260 [Paenibacillaceae bacterium]